MRNDVRGCINNVDSWVKDQLVEKNIVTLLDGTYRHPDPLGVVLIMGAWNYPFQVGCPMSNPKSEIVKFSSALDLWRGLWLQAIVWW